MKAFKYLILVVLALLPLTRVCASSWDDDPAEHYFSYHDTHKPWHEQKLHLPGYPGRSGLLRLQIYNSKFGYFLDPKSISIGHSDHVVRYTVVITAPSGVRNVRYEGIRCDSRAYKMYAFGVDDGPFHKFDGAHWQAIAGQGYNRYRKDLEPDFCNGAYPRRSVAQIIERIQYPPSQ